MASGPTTSWQIDGETMETVADFIFLGSKITADGDCIHEMKRRLLLGRKVMVNLDGVLKSRHHFVNRGPSSQGYGFSRSQVWMWELDYKESWALKNWCFKLWCWRRRLRVPWTARRSTQSILKEISPGCSLKDWCWSWNPNTLATWYKELTHLKRPWCWERLKQGGEGNVRGWDDWMASPTNWTWIWVDSRSWWWTGRPGMLKFMGLQRVRHNWVTELNWMREIMRSKLELSLIKCKTEGSFLPAAHIHVSLLYVYISIAALQIGSSVSPF